MAGRRKAASLFSVASPFSGYMEPVKAPVAGAVRRVRLGKTFYDDDCVSLCKKLLGTVLCRRLPTGEVVRGTVMEVEAYPGGGDCASSASTGKGRARREEMFIPPGIAFVYSVHPEQKFFSLNVSSREQAGACLIRVVHVEQNVEGPDLNANVRKRPMTFEGYPAANSPTKVCHVFDVLGCDKEDLVSSDTIWFENNLDQEFKDKKFRIGCGKRTGIESARTEDKEKLWRFYVERD